MNLNPAGDHGASPPLHDAGVLPVRDEVAN